MFKCPDPSFHPPPPHQRPHCPTMHPALPSEEVLRGCCSGTKEQDCYKSFMHIDKAKIEDPLKVIPKEKSDKPKMYSEEEVHERCPWKKDWSSDDEF